MTSPNVIVVGIGSSQYLYGSHLSYNLEKPGILIKKTKYFDRIYLVLQCVTQILIEKLSSSNWKTKFSILIPKSQVLRSKNVVFGSSARKSHMFIANVNLTIDGKTTFPVRLYRTSS